MGSMHGSHFPHPQEINHMYINLLGYWWGIQWVLNVVILRPRTTVNIEVPEIHTYTFEPVRGIWVLITYIKDLTRVIISYEIY